jgi:hypothetical protein
MPRRKKKRGSKIIDFIGDVIEGIFEIVFAIFK